MGFIEEERRRKAEDAERTARWERERPIMEAEKQRQVSIELARMKEDRRKEVLREQALANSIVPQLANEAAPLLGGTALEGHGSIEIFLDSKVKHEPWGGVEHQSRYTTTRTFIDIQAREDWSIAIGEKVLSPTEARDFKKVEDALERASKHPSQGKTVEDIVSSGPGPSEPGIGSI